MNIGKRLVKWAFKEQYDELSALARDVAADLQMIPYMSIRQQSLLSAFSEMDTQYADFLMRNLISYQAIGGGDTSDSYREKIVKLSRSLYLSNTIIQYATETFTNYAFSNRPTLVATDPAAQEVWNEFFNADRNTPLFGEREIHTLSEDQLRDGELFFVFTASTVDGETTCRTVPTEQIKEIVTDPDDSRVVLYYRRDWTSGTDSYSLYYPDWHASKEQLSRAKLPPTAKKANEVKQETINAPGTDVVMMQAAYRKVNKRGWPMVTAALSWITDYDDLVHGQVVRAKASQSIVEKVKANTGQRGIDMIKQQIGTSLTGSDSTERNPPPAPGSVWLENNQLTREWLNRPTGAQDMEKDSLMVLRLIILAYGMFPHYAGVGEAYRLATATAMEGPILRTFQRYLGFWSSVWRDMSRIVIDFAEEYGHKTFDSEEVKVSTGRILSLSTDDIGKAATALNDMVDRAIIDSATAQAVGRVLIQTELETIGVQGVDEIMNPEPDQAAEAGESRSPFRGRRF